MGRRRLAVCGAVAILLLAVGAGLGPLSAIAAAGVPLSASTSSTIRDATDSAVTTVAAGSTVHDSVTVDGGLGNPVPTGNVTIDWFVNGMCTGAPAATSAPTALAGGSLDATAFPQGPLAAGSYGFLAHYLGDTTYAVSDGVCEPLQVVDADVQITPAAATDQVGNSRTFTIAVAPVDGAIDAGTFTATASIASDTASSSFVGSPSCTYTAISPSCQVVIASATPGLTVVHAATTVSVAGQAIERETSTVPNAAAGGGSDASETWVTPPPPPATHPALSILIDPKYQQPLAGATAYFTVVVTNTGDVPLDNVNVTDPFAPGCANTSATIVALASIAPGASVTYTCTLANVTASFTNVATATGTSPSGSIVSATDSAPVAVVIASPVPPPPEIGPVTHPAIEIVVDPKSQTISSGATATFRITVANAGDVTLSGVRVEDPLARGCRQSLGNLSVGQSQSYTCNRVNTQVSFDDVATAIGRPPAGAAVEATDQAHIMVHPFVPPPPKPTCCVPVLFIAMTASPTVVPQGGTATFSITVHSGPGLTGVHVVDPFAPACTKTIPAGETVYPYTCSLKVTSDLVNVATVYATSPTDPSLAAVSQKIKLEVNLSKYRRP